MDNPFEKTPEELKQNRVTCPNCDEVEFINISIIGSVRCSRCGCLLSPPPATNFEDVTKRRFKVFEERAEQPDHEVTYRGYEPSKEEIEQAIRDEFNKK